MSEDFINRVILHSKFCVYRLVRKHYNAIANGNCTKTFLNQALFVYICVETLEFSELTFGEKEDLATRLIECCNLKFVPPDEVFTRPEPPAIGLPDLRIDPCADTLYVDCDYVDPDYVE